MIVFNYGMMVYRMPEDKTEINEKDMEVKKGLMTTESPEASNLRSETKYSKEKLGVRKKFKNAKTKVKEFVKNHGKAFTECFKPDTSTQVSKHHTTPPPHV